MERQPAEREDHHQAEHGLGHLPALRGEGGQGRRDALAEHWRAAGAKHHLPVLSKGPLSYFYNPSRAGHPSESKAHSQLPLQEDDS